MKATIKKENINSSKRIYEFSKKSLEEMKKEFNLDLSKGLNDSQVEESVNKYGWNSLKKAKKDSKFVKFIKSFLTLFNLILFVIAILNGLISYFFPESENDKKTFYITPLIILAIIFISSLISYKENLKSERSASSLKDLTATTSRVIRNGVSKEISNEDLVVGDIIEFSSGDMVPAEIKLLDAKDLYIDQSSLTGESLPVEKRTDIPQGDISKVNPFDLTNILFNGSSVVSGKGLGVVFSISSQTIFGQLNDKVIQKKVNVSFQKGIQSITKLLLTLICIIVPIIFLIDGFDIHFENGILKAGDFTSYSNWINAFIFSISVAVCLIPSLLPMQVTSNLAKGAVSMSKKKVIVKDINTIFNLGSMDVLCTDKTGTLTENTSTLSQYFDIDMNTSIKILRLAFLNSYFQTGIKSVIDQSIIKYASTNKAISEVMQEGIIKLDEIPFDFARKKLSVLLKDKNGKKFIVSKGAVDNMLEAISFVKTPSGIREINKDDIAKIEDIAQKESSKGRRTLILATKDVENEQISSLDEKDMTFIGFLSFEDSPKKDAKAAIEALEKYGVHVKILTGDTLASSLAICKAINLKDVSYLTGYDISLMSDEDLQKEVESHNLFVKLTPLDKQRIVQALKMNKHVVGFMGDGINDASALKSADVGISFKDATDIAKQASDIIMLENNLTVLKDGIIEGRKSYINVMKYVKGQTSSNFGNMISQSIGALWIPFAPLKAVHIIMLDIISDISCSMIPFDNVEEKDIKQPLNFSVKQIRNFMFYFGPLSSLLDMASFAILMYFICPNMLNANGINFTNYYNLSTSDRLIFASIFQTGFFIESLITQNVVYAFLRSDRIPLIQTRPSITLSLGIIVSCLVGFFVVYVPKVNETFDLVSISPIFILILLLEVIIYGILTQFVKKLYIRKYKRLL